MIKRSEYPTHSVAIDAWSDCGSAKDVAVAAAHRAGTAVKVIWHHTRPLNRDVVWQESIGATDPGELVALKSRVKMDNLHQRMDAGVRAPGTYRGDRSATELGQSTFQNVLDCKPRRLALPALVRASAIANAQRKPHALNPERPPAVALA